MKNLIKLLSIIVGIFLGFSVCANESQKIDISWILISRNDQYFGNPMERLKTTLNHLFKKLEQYNLRESNEVILIDWNSQIPILLNPEISKWLKETNYNLKVLEVPPQIAAKITDSKLSEVHGLNAAARRSNGHFIIRIDQDCVVGDQIFEFICKNCKEDPNLYNSVWWCTRRNTTKEQYKDFIKDPEKFLKENCNNVPSFKIEFSRDPISKYTGLYGFGPVGIFGAPKKIWHENKGYNEELVYYGTMEWEFFYRFKKNKLSMILLNEYLPLENPVYHIWHLRKKLGRSNKKLFKIDHANDIYNVKPNDDSWGLANLDLNVIDSQEYIRILN